MNDQQYLFDPIPNDKYDLLSKDELVALNKGNEDLVRQLIDYNKELKNKLLKELCKHEQKSFFLNEELFNIKHKLFGKSSEKSKKNKSHKSKKKDPKKRVRLPSERYSNLDVVEKEVEHDEAPSCGACHSQMKKSGLFETSEYLTFIPRKYYVVREKRHKYRCACCQGSLVTTPAIPRIVEGGAYSDEMIIDVAMSKFLDLLPIERYTEIASREGLSDLPANSLINTIHKLADILEASYKIIKKEVLSSKVIHADETPHRMLEGDKKSNWYTWGFSSDSASYFEVRDTRSGEVASDLLQDSKCRYLVSDVFSGYKRAVKDANETRETKIEHLYCNAHARRKFKESEKNYEESEYFLKLYRRVYRLNKKDYLEKYPEDKKRRYQSLYMKLMYKRALEMKINYSTHSSLHKALKYFIDNFESLVRFTSQENLPIDNNSQERQLRSPVVGRKTWYGTHSKRGAKTTAIMFSIVQSCKLNKINPREYVTNLVRDLHGGKAAYSPKQYTDGQKNLDVN